MTTIKLGKYYTKKIYSFAGKIHIFGASRI